MDGGMLSQEEINALLAGADKGSGDSSSAADSAAASDDEQFLTEEQKDAIISVWVPRQQHLECCLTRL